MPNTAQEIYNQIVSTLSLNEQLRLANLILTDLVQQNIAVIEQSDTWTEQDRLDLATFSLQHASELFQESEEIAQ